MKQTLQNLTAAVALTLAAAVPAQAATVTIDFDDGFVAAGSALSTQYAFVGATFSGGTGGAVGVVNPPSTTQGFATTTTMMITSSGTGGDNGGSTFTAPISGLVLHSYSSPNGWLGENGDAVFRIDFVNPINFISLDFGSVSTLGASGIFAVNASNQVVQSSFVNVAGTSTLAMTLTQNVKSIVVTEGTYFDYVAVDNIRFTYATAVPEPATNAMFALGALTLGGLAYRRRRQQAD